MTTPENILPGSARADSQQQMVGASGLLPCPWCEALPVFEELPFRWQVRCENPACKIQPKTVKAANLKGAIHFWNAYAKSTIPN